MCVLRLLIKIRFNLMTSTPPQLLVSPYRDIYIQLGKARSNCHLTILIPLQHGDPVWKQAKPYGALYRLIAVSGAHNGFIFSIIFIIFLKIQIRCYDPEIIKR